MISRCDTGVLAERVGKSRRSDTGCGGWPGGPEARTKSRSPRSTARWNLGCNFFDTAWAYGDGHSEHLLAKLLKRHRRNGSTRRQRFRRKIVGGRPVRSTRWTTCIRRNTSVNTPKRASTNIGVVDDRSPAVSRVERHMGRRRPLAARGLETKGRRDSFGLSASASTDGSRPMCFARCETGLIDAVQVVYNVLDQNPEDELFPILPGTRHRQSLPACRSMKAVCRFAERPHRHGRKGISGTSTSARRT